MENSSVLDETDIFLNISINESQIDDIVTTAASSVLGIKHNKKIYTSKCKTCPFQTTSTGNFSRHTLAVHKGRKFTCDTCNNEYSSLFDLKEHMQTAHRNMKLICELCSKSFNSRKGLHVHK